MKNLSKLFALGALALPITSYAADLTVSVQNLTQGVYFTPVLAVAHDSETQLFTPGQAASLALQEMAEGGSLAGLIAQSEAVGANYAHTEGLTAPGAMGEISLTNTAGNSSLSLVAMILPSNDGFIGLDDWVIPEQPGTYTVYLNAYDAGTEANDEIRGGGAIGVPGMPVPPPLEALIGNGGTGVSSVENNNTVHIHRGSIGDEDMEAGISDITSSKHRWLNPIAKVTINVN
ncbi:spondin domain-containing protein [Agarivorans gilvus]|jgi:hypothetical protein|uniref:Spondin domain-containing protein n=1 Tax=Agarivorans gilvus TaxID=680279 RepID=A0ABQ1I6Y0_9ALTE|nr:spondin domain-containing protein [Agarivorans gilvus]GGB21313.1 hypothetical protein GCM10007414_38380 [Agarivorans gilvus]